LLARCPKAACSGPGLIARFHSAGIWLQDGPGRLQIIRGSVGSSACRLPVEGSRADEVRGDGQPAAEVGRNLEEWLGLPLPPSGRSSVQCKCAVQRQMAGGELGGAAKPTAPCARSPAASRALRSALAPNVHFDRCGRSLFRPVSLVLITEV
jgi:hypothetical protein